MCVCIDTVPKTLWRMLLPLPPALVNMLATQAEKQSDLGHKQTKEREDEARAAQALFNSKNRKMIQKYQGPGPTEVRSFNFARLDV